MEFLQDERNAKGDCHVVGDLMGRYRLDLMMEYSRNWPFIQHYSLAPSFL
jgi:hypothetical protein